MTTQHTNAKELSIEDLRDNFAVMVNNAITEGREAQVTQLVAEFQATQVVLPRKTVVERGTPNGHYRAHQPHAVGSQHRGPAGLVCAGLPVGR